MIFEYLWINGKLSLVPFADCDGRDSRGEKFPGFVYLNDKFVEYSNISESSTWPNIKFPLWTWNEFGIWISSSLAVVNYGSEFDAEDRKMKTTTITYRTVR